MSEINDLLQRWKRISCRLDPTLEHQSWGPLPPDRFLHAFRPDGARLPDLFAGLPAMVPVLERLQRLFEWGGASNGLYLHVDRPRPMSDAELTAAVRSWLNGAAALADDLAMSLGHQVRSFLGDRLMRVELVDAHPPEASHPVRSALAATVAELGHSMTLPPVGELLVEPLYKLARNHELAWWALSPLAPETHDDPLAPAMALWEGGVTLRFEGDGPVRAMAYRQRAR